MNPVGGGVTSLPVGCSGLAPDGSAIKALTTEGTSVRAVNSGRWSRQGTKVAYTYLVENVPQLTDDRALFVRLADGSGRQRLTPVGMQVHSPSWGP
jgi:hypothetical protein